MNLYTTAEAAAFHKVCPGRLRSLARLRGVTPLKPNLWNQTQVNALTPKKPGRRKGWNKEAKKAGATP